MIPIEQMLLDNIDYLMRIKKSRKKTNEQKDEFTEIFTDTDEFYIRELTMAYTKEEEAKIKGQSFKYILYNHMTEPNSFLRGMIITFCRTKESMAILKQIHHELDSIEIVATEKTIRS